MVGKKDIRNYEVSIWTLQDSFITVLKPLNLEYKGLIQDGKITLQDDGENRISFSIPMYITQNGECIENPLWYNKKEGYLVANLRKLKIIFNKKTQNEKVFEFLITKVTESHEGFEKICSIEGEGLAFNELGKQGYKISLSADDLYAEVKEKIDELGQNDSVDTIYVKNNINYWVDKVLEGTKWKYSIQMDWSITDGIIDETYTQYGKSYEDLTEEERETLNTNRANRGLRRHDCIYEDTYVSSWDIVNNSLIPIATIDMMEKLRVIDSSDSNRYNLIQTIAETFEVYTKFKYYYDDNYHIIGREIIFYNNFLNENDFIDLNYSYDTKSISRELDATDIVTKMYVKSLDDDTYLSGLASIADTEANKTREDYLLNFDYLYDIKTISNEQYAAIKDFETNIAILNKDIIKLDNEIILLNKKILDAEVARDNALLITKEAQENINYINDKIQQIYDTYKDSTGQSKTEWKVESSNPAFVYVSQNINNSNEYIGKFSSQYSGIDSTSIVVYSNKNNPTNSKISFAPIISNDGEVTLNFGNITPPTNGYFYSTFNYKPALKNEKLLEKYQTLYTVNYKKWQDKVTELGRKLDDNGKEIKTGTGLKDDLEEKEQDRKKLYEQKKELISKFENLMGPALREGNWQPEDEYSNYGNQYDEIIIPSYTINQIINPSEKLKFIWDKELFDDEEKNYYESGINQEKIYYPCVDLTQINANFIDKLKIEELRNQLTLVYKVQDNPNPYLYPQGANCQFAFVQKTGTNGAIIPVLMLTNLGHEINIPTDLTAAYLTFTSVNTLLGNNITVDNSTVFSVTWLSNPNLYNIVYSRLQFNFENLKTGEGELFLNIYREQTVSGVNVYTYIEELEEFSDYYIMSRDEKKYITIKPEVLIASKVGQSKIKINYSISNTALQIYLDAIKVMKENAYPKVSYTVNNILSQKLLRDTYNRLGQLAHINDAELKFQNVMGYISSVELNLDKPWEDSITIKNYKTKFEDLFSTIVAQTEEMKKNAARFNVAVNAFSSNGMLIAPFAQESLLKSPQVLNNLIKNNADIIATRAVGQAASDKAALAMTRVYSVMNGNTGIAFTGNNINSIALNQDDGLVVAGKTTYQVNGVSTSKSVFFKLDNSNMGFFEGEVGDYSKPQLFYSNGDLALSGTIYSSHGWFGGQNGWIIGSNKLPSNNTTGLGGLLYSANGKAIFTSMGGGTNQTDPMIILTKIGFSTDKQNAALLFDGTNLYISGTITAAANSNIGGWIIGSNYIGSGVTRAQSVVGMSNINDNNSLAFWAGATAADASASDQAIINNAKFSVTKSGYLTSTSGKIANWNISDYELNSGSKSTYVALNSGASTVTGGSNYAIWAGAEAASSAPFRVTKGGALTSTSLTVGFGDNLLTYTSSGGLTVKGNVTATTGSIGGWTIGTSALYLNNATPGASTSTLVLSKGTKSSASIGGSPASTEKTWMISASTKFGVTTAGDLYANSANITGAITANTGYIGGTSGWIIKSQQIYHGTAEAVSDGSITLSTKNISKTINETALTNLRLIIGSNFGVTSTGALYAKNAVISGAITATSGHIGGWTVGTNVLYKQNTVDSSLTGYQNSPYGLKITGDIALWIGGALNNTNINTNNSDISELAPFRVTNTGKIYAKNAELSGATITGATTINTSGKVTVSGSSVKFNVGDKESDPNFLSFSFQPDQGDEIYRNITIINKGNGEKSKITLLPSQILLEQDSSQIDMFDDNSLNLKSREISINGEEFGVTLLGGLIISDDSIEGTRIRAIRMSGSTIIFYTANNQYTVSATKTSRS